MATLPGPRSRVERWRLFVALELPGEWRSGLGGWAREAAGALGLRAVGPEAMHVTLAFLGARACDEAPRIAAAVGRVRGMVDGVRPGAVRWLSPRVLAVELEDPQGGLAALQRDVVATVAATVSWRPESRPFLAHVSLARGRRRAAASRGERPRHGMEVAAAPPSGRRGRADGRELALVGMPVTTLAPLAGPGVVTLFRSTPGSGGARYQAL